MTVRTKMIQLLMDKIKKISDNELERVLSYVDKIENLTEQKKAILSFAGSWKDIDDETFNDFTKNLHKNRLEESSTDNP